jgi:prolyl oligopeptidase
MSRILAMASAVALVAANAIAQTAPAQPADPFIWLEDVNGARAMDWVKAENAKSLAVLEKDARFPGLYADALRIAEAKDRIPAPEFLSGRIFNFWQDSDHVRGIWRHTALDDYARPEPAWTTTLDLDALSKAENANWVWKGASSSRAASRCPMASRPRPGRIRTRSWSLANGRRAS